MIIELIYFDGCPNEDAARKNIKNICKKSEQSIEFKEWEQSNEDLPEYAKGYGSPTVLVNGKDIVGEEPNGCEHGGCRIYSGMTGIPSIEIIEEAIEKITGKI